MYLQKVMSRNTIKRKFFVGILKPMTKIAGFGSISQRHGSADPDPDPLQNVMDPERNTAVSFVVLYKN
jgi:hypothetical protein